MVIKSQVRAAPPLVRHLANGSRTTGRQPCRRVSGDEPERRAVVLRRAARERRKCQVVRKDNISRMTGLVQGMATPLSLPAPSNPLSWSKR